MCAASVVSVIEHATHDKDSVNTDVGVYEALVVSCGTISAIGLNILLQYRMIM